MPWLDSVPPPADAGMRGVVRLYFRRVCMRGGLKREIAFMRLENQDESFAE